MFTFHGPFPRCGTNEVPLVGFSSAWVEPGDEVWQFYNTPVALIARSHSKELSFVGRAFLLAPREGGSYAVDPSSERTWKELVDTGSCMRRDHMKVWPQKWLQVGFATLLDILEWVDFAT